MEVPREMARHMALERCYRQWHNVVGKEDREIKHIGGLLDEQTVGTLKDVLGVHLSCVQAASRCAHKAAIKARDESQPKSILYPSKGSGVFCNFIHENQ